MQPINKGSEIYLNETVRTGVNGKGEFLLADRTNLTVAPLTTIKLDEFVYSPSGSAGRVVLNVKDGAFRFITGVQASNSYEIKTPYATMGVREHAKGA